MERLSFAALGLAILLHSVMGISYYFVKARCSPAPLLGSWLFIACIGAVLHSVHIFPQWCRNCSALCRLIMETAICCLTLDVMLSKFWCRIESVCHCAIVGILGLLVTEKCTFDSWEYWLLGVTTSIIGGCLLWLTLWATALTSKMRLDYSNWQHKVSHLVRQTIYHFVFGPMDLQSTKVQNSEECEQSFAS
ncbi:GH11998 [Drosophila grimshawi]|uniref:GH11998 n=2 Tax=Drosophila grimshawi TaxID=7222 RepID=B4JKT3_DROGR|nr:GH11998 [Drosophila grimshawi]